MLRATKLRSSSVGYNISRQFCATARYGQSHQAITLPDGRSLSWREYGEEGGFPIIYLHGTLNSRLFTPVWAKTDELTVQAGARVIALDRPGYGYSDYAEERTYLSSAQDIASLAKHLDLSKVAVLGYSSGGPNALVCAHLLPDLVAACGLISSDGPYTAMDPSAGEAVFGIRAEEVTPELAAERKAENASEMMGAYESIKDEQKRALAVNDLNEALRQGLVGAIQDSILETSGWGYELQDVDSVPVLIWHGTKDSDVPCQVGRHLAENISSVHEAVFIEGENHTLLRRHWADILIKTIAVASGSETTMTPSMSGEDIVRD
jgi:pimeloyl-ACP methyl ester carboxylesterase